MQKISEEEKAHIQKLVSVSNAGKLERATGVHQNTLRSIAKAERKPINKTWIKLKEFFINNKKAAINGI
jgi:hypothetical protein